MAIRRKPTAQDGQDGAKAAEAIPTVTTPPYAAAETLREASEPIEATPKPVRSVAPGRDRLGWQIERVEAIENRIDVHVMWTKRQTDGQVELVARDTLQIYPRTPGAVVTETDILAAMDNRAQMHILPTYFDPKIRTEEAVAYLAGRTGTLADLPESI